MFRWHAFNHFHKIYLRIPSIKNCTKIFYLAQGGNVLFFRCKMWLGSSITTRETVDLRLIVTYFNIPVLTTRPRLCESRAVSSWEHNFLCGQKGKGKTIPLQARTGPECSRRLRLPDFKTIGTRRCKVVSPTHRPPLTPGKIPGTHLF